MICVLVLISAVPRLETFSTVVTQMTQTLNVSLHMIFHVSLCPHNFVADSAGKLRESGGGVFMFGHHLGHHLIHFCSKHGGK